MKLAVLVLLCALSAAEPPAAPPTQAQVTIALGHLFRRFLHAAAPKQLALQDALGMSYTNGKMMGPPTRSATRGTFDGHEHDTFSYITSLLNPEQKSLSDNGPWLRQDVSDMVIAHHYGSAMRVHMITAGGLHKDVIVGNPLQERDAKLMVVVPKRTYVLLESLSEETANFHSYVVVPGYEPSGSHYFQNNKMAEKFPEYADLFHRLEKPGVDHSYRRRGRRHGGRDDHDDDDHEDDDHDQDDRDDHHGRRRRH